MEGLAWHQNLELEKFAHHNEKIRQCQEIRHNAGSLILSMPLMINVVDNVERMLSLTLL
jgi:hypothetical protein